jgi:hypothetical protein
MNTTTTTTTNTTTTTTTAKQLDCNTHPVNALMLSDVLYRLDSLAFKYPGSAPIKGRETCSVVDSKFGEEPIGFSKNANGVMRTRFRNVYFTVSQLAFYSSKLPNNWQHKSGAKQKDMLLDELAKSKHQGLVLSHLCDVQNCIELSHMVLETRQVNQSRINCLGYLIYGHKLISVCLHRPHCLKVVNHSESTTSDALLSYELKELKDFSEYGRFVSKRKACCKKMINDNLKQRRDIAKLSRQAKGNGSKQEKKTIVQQRKDRKRRTRRKERKEAKRLRC